MTVFLSFLPSLTVALSALIGLAAAAVVFTTSSLLVGIIALIIGIGAAKVFFTETNTWYSNDTE